VGAGAGLPLNRSFDGSGGLAETARRLGGVHAQVMSCAELALAARVDGVRAEDVRDALWERRELVKTWAMRGTLHLLPADDLALWAGALRTRSYLWRRPSWTRYFGISLEELEALVAAIGASLDGRGLTREELGEAVGKVAGPRPRGDGVRLGLAVEAGRDGGRGRVRAEPRAERRVRQPARVDRALRAAALGGGHGRGRSALAPRVRARLAGGPGLVVGRRARPRAQGAGSSRRRAGRGERRRAWALESEVGALEKARPDGPARLLPGFDPHVVGFPPRDALVEPEFKARVSRTAGWISPVVLVDGRAVGVWEDKLRKGTMEITVEPFRKLPAARRRELAVDAERLAGALDATPSVVVA
jgi:DNA glycosylase AlkZ-like